MTYVIAEVGINHDGNMQVARRLIDIACEAGADAAKFQLFHMEHLKQYQLTNSNVELLQYYCNDRNIEFLCTPFDKEAVDFLVPLVKRFKIGSGQANDADFVEYAASKGKPIILSTGMSEFSDIRHALVNVDVPVTLLHCTSLYPTPPGKANLQRLKDMQKSFCLPIGYSDHTEGIEIALAAAALGAVVIEKHITLDKNAPGPDHKASITPEELKNLVKGIRNIEKALL